MGTGRHRLVLWKDTKRPDAKPIFVELYDHQKDPTETENVAGQHPELVNRLVEQFNKGWKASRAPLPR